MGGFFRAALLVVLSMTISALFPHLLSGNITFDEARARSMVNGVLRDTRLWVEYIQDMAKIPSAGAAFAARTACSGVFVTERPMKSIRKNELAGLFTVFFCDVDDENKEVACSLFGTQWHERKAKYMDGVRGCRLIGTSEAENASINKPISPAEIEPYHFERDFKSKALDEVIANQFTLEAHEMNQTRALLVIHKGKLVGQGYSQHVSVTEDSKLLGWSMTKSVHALVIGAAIQKGLLSLDTEVKLSDMSPARRQAVVELNGGRALTFGDLIRMSDILEMSENYKIGADVSQMLFGNDDSGAYASSKSTRDFSTAFHRDKGPQGLRDHGSLWEGLGGKAVPSAKGGQTSLGWYYSSGVSNILAKEFRALFASDEEYWRFPQEALFAPIGANDFVIETDTSGTFLASSLSYATAVNWAKLGQLLLQRGAWNGVQVLGEAYVDWALTPHPHSAGVYGGSIWLNPSSVSVHERADLPASGRDNLSKFRWMSKVLPADAFTFSGYQEQMVLGVPSLDLVVVRIGFTKREDDGVLENEDKAYSKAALLRQILTALQ